MLNIITNSLVRSIIIIGCALQCAINPTAFAGSTGGQLIVPGQAAIYDAGQAEPTLDGLVPPGFALPGGAGRYLEISSATGIVTYRVRTSGPEGFGDRNSTIDSANGISGILAPRFFFLAGVFLDDILPVGDAPPALDFHTIGTGFPSLAPALNQTFYIGDGLSGIGTGDRQRFIVPDGATRLFMGFADAGNFTGPPGAYFDNGGLLDVQFNLVASALSGDLNADGFMGIEDLNIVLSNWNQLVTPGDYLLGDPTGDGFVGIEDLNVVLGNWNAGTPPGDMANIPEPGIAFIAVLGLISLAGRRAVGYC